MKRNGRFQLPDGYRVRYDFHNHPRGVSAVVIGPLGTVRSVGFAKFNPRDERFDTDTGMSIARGRALAKLPRHLTQPARDRTESVREQLEMFGRSVANDLVLTD